MKDKNSRKSTKILILDALLRLMSQRSIKEITAKEIAWEAGVSRRTFYSYYGSKLQVLTSHGQALIDQFRNDYIQNNEPDRGSFLRLLCRFWHDNIVFFKTVLTTPEVNPLVIFEDVFSTIFGQKKLTSPGMDAFEAEQLQNFINGGLYYLIYKWMTSATPESPERMAELINSFISGLPGAHEEIRL